MASPRELVRTLSFLSEDAKTLGMSDLAKLYEAAAVNRASEVIMTCEGIATARFVSLLRHIAPADQKLRK